jgi:hypothetical protein
MHQYPPKIVSSHSMEAVMRHGDIEWAVECYISDREPLDHPRQHPDDIQVLLRKHQRFLVTFLQEYPQIEDLNIL